MLEIIHLSFSEMTEGKLDFVGVIVMHDYPLMSEYIDVGLISIHQISTLA
jgi:hypothetical protein